MNNENILVSKKKVDLYQSALILSSEAYVEASSHPKYVRIQTTFAPTEPIAANKHEKTNRVTHQHHNCFLFSEVCRKDQFCNTAPFQRLE